MAKRRFVKSNVPKSRVTTLGPNSIIVYRRTRGMSDDDFSQFLNDAANDILARFGLRTIVVGVDKWSELRVINEEEMERLGWVRKDRVFMFKDEARTLEIKTSDEEE